MTINYWTNFSKRRNSTKQPTSGTSLTVNLKEGTSIEHPVFLLSGDLFMVNYVEAFGHYYFVDDVKSVRNGLTEISCSMDVLATFKATIGSYNGMIERSSHTFETKYADPAVSMQNAMTSAYSQFGPDIFSTSGFFALSVLNNIGSGTGFTTTYLITASELKNLAAYVNTDWGSAATDVLSWLQATFLKTANSIISCVWLPLKTSVITGSYEVVRIGVDNVSTVHAYRLTSAAMYTGSDIGTLPHIYSSGDFRRCAPFSTGKIFIPGFGTTDLNLLDFEPSGRVGVYFAIDLSTGDTLCCLFNSSSVTVSSYIYNIGVQCPVGKVGADVTSTIGGILTTASNIAVANAMTHNPVGQIAMDYAAASSGINTIASALGTTASVSGSKAGRAAWYANDACVLEVFARTTQDLASMQATSGRPCMAAHTISTIPGYIKCINASVDIPGMAGEKQMVNDFLNSGFYYE